MYTTQPSSSTPTHKNISPFNKTNDTILKLVPPSPHMISSDLQEQELEIIKAVAQAWLSHSHSNFLNQANEFDTRISTKFKTRPSRFKAEAKTLRRGCGNRPGDWDFNQSLLDPYEIVAVSKRLEDGMLVPDQEFLDPYCSWKSKKTRRESKNSLRSLFSQLALSTFD